MCDFGPEYAVTRKSMVVALRLCSVFVTTIVMVTLASAQYHFDAFTTDNGLPHNSINAIVQSHDGYLWLATTDGIVRYDGVRFTVFNVANSPGIKSNRCTSVFEDKSGQLWIGTEDSGLMIYSDGVFKTYGLEQGFPGIFVRKIWSDPNGDVILYVNDAFYKWENDRAVLYLLPTSAPPDRIYSGQQNGRVWYLDQTSLHILTASRTITVNKAEGLSSLNVNTVYEDPQNNIWVGTDAGLNLIKDGKVQVFTTKDGLPENYVRTIVVDRSGNLWVAGRSSGITLYKDGHFTNFTTAQGLSDNAVNKLYVDREDTLWICTVSHGLNRSSKEAVHTISTEQGLPSNNIYPIFEDREGNVWIATWSKGLTRYRDGKFTLYQSRDGLGSPIISALGEDSDGAIWIGAYSGMTRFKDGKFTSFSQWLEPGIHHVSAIMQDREGALWVGSNNGLLRMKDGVRTFFTTKDGLAGDDVRAIIQDHNGVIWAGSYGGLEVFENGSWRAFTKKDGLMGEKIRSLYEDKDGVLWVGTYDGGISRVKNGKIVSVSQKDGLYSNGAFQMLEDDRGFFWLSCNTGIYRVSKQQLNDFADGKIKVVFSVAYGKDDGLVNNECNGGTQPSGVRLRDGQLWFPTQGGIAVIDPDQVSFNPTPPPVAIENCLLDREATDCQQNLKIQSEEQNLEISYAGLSFIKSEQVRFKYKLVGLDSDWVDAGTRRTAYYSHLPPGDYTFTVIAANSDGVWNTTGQSIHIIVIPAFWRTWWFISLSIIAIGAAGLFLYRQRVRQLEKRSALQAAFSRQLIESQENERMRIASELHD